MTTQNSQQTLADSVLEFLYTAYFEEGDARGLLDLRNRLGINENEFEKIVDRLDDDNLIYPFSGGYTYKITPTGIIYTEEHGLVPETTIKTNQNARTCILDELAKVYEKEGKYGSVHFQTIAENKKIDANIILYNILMLEQLDYVEAVSGGFSKITNQGLDAVEEWKKRLEVVTLFEEISKMKPQPRGVKLQDLIANIAERQGWEKEVSVKTSNEELDVIIYQERDFFLIECKWEKNPIEAKDIRDFYAKLASREGVKGIFISLSSFTSGAEEVVLSFMNNRLILLFGAEDINSLVYENLMLEDLINQKYKQLITKKKVLFK